jgi:hypothetical protein
MTEAISPSVQSIARMSPSKANSVGRRKSPERAEHVRSWGLKWTSLILAPMSVNVTAPDQTSPRSGCCSPQSFSDIHCYGTGL